jgi:hypothetical protein
MSSVPVSFEFSRSGAAIKQVLIAARQLKG